MNKLIPVVEGSKLTIELGAAAYFQHQQMWSHAFSGTFQIYPFPNEYNNLYGDQQRLEHVIKNLLSNVFKHVNKEKSIRAYIQDKKNCFEIRV